MDTQPVPFSANRSTLAETLLDDTVNGQAGRASRAGLPIRNPALDGLRTLAILPVLAMHSGAPWGQGGYIGVDVFFVLSGYLITTLLRAEYLTFGDVRLGRFYFHRALRLTPQLMAMLLVFIAVAPLAFPGTRASFEALLTALYLTDYSRLLWSGPTLLAHTWSLSVEEHFYLLWPVVLPFIVRARSPARVMCLTYLVATTWRIANLQWFGWEATYFRFDTRLSGIILGSWLAVVRPPALPRLAAWGAIALISVLVVVPTRWTASSMLIVVTLAELAAVVVLLEAENGGAHIRQALAHPIPAYIGRLTYGLYLWHFPVMLWMGPHVGWLSTFGIGTATALILSAAVHHTIDVPIGRWRSTMADWQERKRRKPAPLEPSS